MLLAVPAMLVALLLSRDSWSGWSDVGVGGSPSLRAFNPCSCNAGQDALCSALYSINLLLQVKKWLPLVHVQVSQHHHKLWIPQRAPTYSLKG
jgi:hypothetical protein